MGSKIRPRGRGQGTIARVSPLQVTRTRPSSVVVTRSVPAKMELPMVADRRLHMQQGRPPLSRTAKTHERCGVVAGPPNEERDCLRPAERWRGRPVDAAVTGRLSIPLGAPDSPYLKWRGDGNTFPPATCLLPSPPGVASIIGAAHQRLHEGRRQRWASWALQGTARTGAASGGSPATRIV